MRPIRIRTWHKQLHEFVPSHKHNVIDVYGNICPTEFVENTEFTGLKDTYGTDIYEGDLLDVKYDSRDHHYYGEVVFSDGSFGIKLSKVPTDRNYHYQYDVGSTPELNNFTDMKIIGNKYNR